MRASSRLGDKDEVTAINGDISIRARGGRPRHLAPIHYEDAPAALRELPPPAPAHPRHPRTLRGASMQQVRAQLCLLRDAQLNMDVIEKRVSGNERVHNWWAAGAGPE
uniref:SFRICE_008155 n=1 Tax=Spodoptera frugiperda TaxID=7108 RepID=A0A2H1VEU4_SPOFR